MLSKTIATISDAFFQGHDQDLKPQFKKLFTIQTQIPAVINRSSIEEYEFKSF